MDARDLGQDKSDIPNAVRRQELERFQNENIAQMVAGLQVENTATSSFNTSRGGVGSSTYNTSIMSETLRRYQAASY